MKILVISLLRIGDLILHQEVIRSIRRSHPNSHISCLINDTVLIVCDLIPEVDEWIVFDRSDLQKKMNERQRWIFSPVLHLEKLIHDLRARQFDQVINLSHTIISGHLNAQLSSVNTEVRGLCLEPNGQMASNLTSLPMNKALAYFNSEWSIQSRPLFHYIEILALVTGYPVNFPKQTTRNLADSFVLSFQVSTSDERKHFSLEKWFDLLLVIHKKLPEFKLQILTSPQEHTETERKIRFIEQKVGHLIPQLVITPCSLSESIELIADSAVFVTHDTSLLHLAGRTRTPIVQLSLGSSHIYKTSSLVEGTVVLSANQSCFPCMHQAQCPLPQFDCHEDIDSEDLLSAIEFQLSNNKHQLLSSLSVVQIVDGLWWLQNKRRADFSLKQALHVNLGGQLQSGEFPKGVTIESRNSGSFDVTIG